MKAIVLIEMETGELKGVIRDLRKIHGVDEAHLTFGPFDAITVIEADDLNHIARIVERDIQPIPGVKKTLTCLLVEGELPIPERMRESGVLADVEINPQRTGELFGIN